MKGLAARTHQDSIGKVSEDGEGGATTSSLESTAADDGLRMTTKDGDHASAVSRLHDDRSYGLGNIARSVRSRTENGGSPGRTGDGDEVGSSNFLPACSSTYLHQERNHERHDHQRGRKNASVAWVLTRGRATEER